MEYANSDWRLVDWRLGLVDWVGLG